jgi:hypothetical protein
MATLCAAHHEEPLHSSYQRLCAKSKPAKVALIAAVGKLLIILKATLRPLYLTPTMSSQPGGLGRLLGMTVRLVIPYS